jgi:hypothetical protein
MCTELLCLPASFLLMINGSRTQHSTRKDPSLNKQNNWQIELGQTKLDKMHQCALHWAALLTSEFSPNDWWLRNPRHSTRKDLPSPSLNKQIPWKQVRQKVYNTSLCSAHSCFAYQLVFSKWLMAPEPQTLDKERSTFYQAPSLNKQSITRPDKKLTKNIIVQCTELLCLPASFLQMIDGSGTPDTRQGKKTSWPSTASISWGLTIHSGGTRTNMTEISNGYSQHKGAKNFQKLPIWCQMW